MASGTPALCATAAGSLSLVEHEVTGLLAEPTSAGFAVALERLARDEALRRRLGGTARERSLDYSWNTILGRLVDNYYAAIDDYQPLQQKNP